MTSFDEKMRAEFDALPETEKRVLQQMIEGINSGRGGLFHVVVEHDQWCPKPRGGTCCCRPNERIMNHEQFEQYLSS
jgi:hypothetical protein